MCGHCFAFVPLAAISPYDRVPFAVIPITADPAAVDVPQIIETQMHGRIRPITIELPVLLPTTLPAVTTRARTLTTSAHSLVMGPDKIHDRDSPSIGG